MRTKVLLLALLFISFFSCEIAEEPIENPIAEDPLVEDEKEPELTVIGFADVIETNTDISISIVDESTVETKVMHDGEEIASSSEKQFNLSINPYGIPVGSTDFMVVSKDAKGNEISETYSVEIKHLLMNLGFSALESASNFKKWFFFNKLDGTELTSIDPIVGNTKIYTDQIIEEDKILLSHVNYRHLELSTADVKNLHVRTSEIPLGRANQEAEVIIYPEYDNTVQVNIQGLPKIDGQESKYVGFGSDYTTTNQGGDAQRTELILRHQALGAIFLRTNSKFELPVFDGKKENYKYLIVLPDVGDTTLEVDTGDFQNAESNEKLDIPIHDAGSFVFTRGGFEGADKSSSRSHRIYEKSEIDDTENLDFIDLPRFSMFDHYDNMLNYTLNNHEYSTRDGDSDLDVNMPNWIVEAQITPTHVEMIGNNQEVDYYYLSLDKRYREGGNSRFLSWAFNLSDQSGGPNIMPRLSLPKLITDAIGESYFETTDDLEKSRLFAMDYRGLNSYDEYVEWQVFDPNYLTDITKYRRVTYPISNDSDKSTVSDKSDNLGQLHRFVFDGNGQPIK